MANTDIKSEFRIDTFGPADKAPDMANRFVGATNLAEVTESLRRRDEFRDQQNDAAARGGPVRRD
jgi:hypothetical protein